MKTFFNAAAYIRLSREDGDKAESDSISNQKRLIADYVKEKEDLTVYDTYVDDGFSGTDFNRPSFRRMIDDIEDRKVNCVIVKDLSRFGRDYIDTGRYLERYFPERDVRFISVTDNIDSAKQAYDMLLPIKNIFNEQYARDISQKIHAAVRTKQKAGEFIGAFASYGYRKAPADKNRLVVDVYAAEVVRRIFELYIRGCGKLRIAAILNGEGIVCPSEYKKINGENYRNAHRLDSTSYWTYSTINRILQNEMYIGNMVQGRKHQQMRSRARTADRGEWIVVQGTHEAIIDKDTWEKTQELLKRRTRNVDLQKSTAVFAGFLKCGDCGRALVKKAYAAEHNGKKNVSGITYYCGTYVRSGRQYCTPHKIGYETLEKIILDDLRVMLQSMDNLEELAAEGRADSMTMPSGMTAPDSRENGRIAIRTELEKVRKLKKAIYEDYREELISKEEFVSYRQDYAKREEMLEKELACMEEKRGAMETGVLDNAWLQHLLQYREVEKLDRAAAVEMLHEIKVYENHKIKIIYNFSGESSSLFADNAYG